MLGLNTCALLSQHFNMSNVLKVKVTLEVTEPFTGFVFIPPTVLVKPELTKHASPLLPTRGIGG